MTLPDFREIFFQEKKGVGTVDTHSSHTSPACTVQTAIIFKWTEKKGFDFLFHLASAWCWDGFQSSLPLSVCTSRTISPLVSSTPVSAPQMCTCCAVYLLEQQHLHHQTQDELNNQAAFRLSTGQLHCPLPPFTLNCTHTHSPCFCSSKTHNGIWAANVN